MTRLLNILIAILPQFFSSDAKPVYKAAVALALLAAVTAWLLLGPVGCMTTTDLDGRVYSWRLDILTPILPTTGPGQPAAPAYRPANGTVTPRPTTNPAR